MSMSRSGVAGPRTLSRISEWRADAVQDLRYALRQLRRSPGVATLIVVTLAIGIGANATMFSAIDRLLLRPPAQVMEPDRVTRLLFTGAQPSGQQHVTALTNYPELLDLQRDVSSFERVAAYSAMSLSLGAGSNAVEIRASVVSAEFFGVLGVRPALGRFFDSRDAFPVGETSGGPPLAVLGFGFWRRQFAGDSGVVGRAVRIGTVTYTVVGVGPEGFRGVEVEAPDVWLPITVTAPAEAAPLWFAGRGATWLSIVSRLRPSASRAMAEQQATAVWRRTNELPGTSDSHTRVVAASLIPGRGPDMPREIKVVLWLGGVAALVLLLACANVANLLLSRAFVRRHEIAIRLALGAGRGRLSRQMIAEALLLAGIGGLAAALVAYAGGQLLGRLLVVRAGGGGLIDLRQFAFTALVALSTGILISLAPLAQSISSDLTTSLRSGATGGGARTSRMRAILLATQAMVCMILLVGAALFAESLRRIEGLDLGVDRDNTLIVSFDLSGYALPRPLVNAMYDEILRRVRATPGVVHVALADKNPYRNGRAIAAHTLTHDADYFVPHWVMQAPMEAAVDSGFFRTVGATMRGRDFTSIDRAGAPPVAIINEPLAKLLWPGEEPLGQCMLVTQDASDRTCVTVVGVLRGFWRRSILNREQYLVYRPLAQSTVFRPAGLFIAIRGDANEITRNVRRAFQSVRSDLPAVRIARMSDVIEPEIRPWRVAAALFTLFGCVALTIAVIGMYGVVATNAAQRSSEIAVRIALGARTAHVLSAVAGDGLRAVAGGLALGAVAALVAGHWIGPLLFETSPRDPWIMIGVASLLLVVTAVASLIPTARALRRDPALILRAD